jgi:putative Mg2+ transporter-C (MgtC) family protein
MPLFEQEILESLFRLFVAMLAGMAIGLDRDLRNKPVGMRTLGLVSLGAALVVLSCTGFGSLQYEQDAVSRVIQGILTGIGFLGAGVILRDRSGMQIHGLTTAATVWMAAGLGIAAGLGAWAITIAGSALTLALLVLGRPLEQRLERMFRSRASSTGEPADD